MLKFLQKCSYSVPFWWKFSHVDNSLDLGQGRGPEIVRGLALAIGEDQDLGHVTGRGREDIAVAQQAEAATVTGEGRSQGRLQGHAQGRAQDLAQDHALGQNLKVAHEVLPHGNRQVVLALGPAANPRTKAGVPWQRINHQHTRWMVTGLAKWVRMMVIANNKRFIEKDFITHKIKLQILKKK